MMHCFRLEYEVALKEKDRACQEKSQQYVGTICGMQLLIKKLENENNNISNSCSIQAARYQELLQKHEEQKAFMSQAAETVQKLQRANAQLKEYIRMMDVKNRMHHDVPPDIY